MTPCINMWFLAGLIGLSAFTLVAQNSDMPAASSNGTTGDWSFDVVPYLWVAGYDGTIGLPTLPPGTPPIQSTGGESFATHLSAAAMLTAQVRYRDVGLFLDGAWLRLNTEGDPGTPLYSGAQLKSDIGYGTLALTYRLPPLAKLRTDLLAGARVWYIANEIEFEPGQAPGYTADSSRTWCDPIIGANLRYDLTRHWFGTVLGDVGGFGAGSDITWSVFGGVGYQFTTWLSATLGYRYMHVDYNQDRFVMNVNVQGFLLGIGFHF